MKVSYLVPLYNKEDFIVECIESILEEDTKEFEIEICIVDDGSTDNSLRLVTNKFGSNKHIKIASFPKNKGKNAACNKALEISTGDYICLFGADDVVVSGRTVKLLEASINNENKAAYGGLVAKNGDLTSELYRALPKKPNLYSITIANSLSGGCCLIPRTLCMNIFPIPENLRFEDWWISYFLVKNNNVVIVDEYVTYYRIGIQNDCGFFGGDEFENIKKDYLRHFDYLNEFNKYTEDKYIEKAIDLRNAFCGRKLNRLFYFSPFDFVSIKIILYKVFGARVLYKIKDFVSYLKNK